jgi:hypothetical protein
MRRNNTEGAEVPAAKCWVERFLCFLFPVSFIVAVRLLYGYPVKSNNLSLIKNLSQNTQQETLDQKPNVTTNHQQRRQEQERPLNVVLFYADDWTMKILGKLNPLVQTLNIDHISDNGMLFTNNCVTTTSVCWMSRATLMTGSILRVLL